MFFAADKPEPGLQPFQHFQLKRPPFEAAPDPRAFCATEPHAEALATLEYALYSRKPCTVLVGESGTGKTLLARMMARTASLQATVLWLPGLGQPQTHSEIYIFPRGTLCGSDCNQPPLLANFSDWIREHSRSSPSTVLIVDNADCLPSHGWRDVLILLSREVLFSEPVRIGLFGLPGLLRRLAGPEMVQIRRRIFRTAVLQPLTRRDMCVYLNGRLVAAGGRLEDLFTSEALDQMHRLTRGIPACLNQLCENAMLEAMSAGRTRITAADILAAAHAVNGARQPLHTVWKSVKLLNRPALQPPAAQASAAARLSRTPPGAGLSSATRGLSLPSGGGLYVPRHADSIVPLHFTQQLQHLENRLHMVLSSMHRACAVTDAALARTRQSEPPLSSAPTAPALDSTRPEQERP